MRHPLAFINRRAANFVHLRGGRPTTVTFALERRPVSPVRESALLRKRLALYQDASGRRIHSGSRGDRGTEAEAVFSSAES